jgi:hypothetical protein
MKLCVFVKKVTCFNFCTNFTSTSARNHLVLRARMQVSRLLVTLNALGVRTCPGLPLSPKGPKLVSHLKPAGTQQYVCVKLSFFPICSGMKPTTVMAAENGELPRREDVPIYECGS